MPTAAPSTAVFCAAPGFRFRLRVRECPLHFRRPARTSRGDLAVMSRWEIVAETEDGRCGLGEATPMPGLSPEAGADYGERLHAACREVEAAQSLAPAALAHAPSMRFGIETALLSARRSPLWDSDFARGEQGLHLHHLIWMDSTAAMLARMEEGIELGFSCLKLKVGALPWAEEIALLQEARRRFPQAEIRVDANGAFSVSEAPARLAELAEAGVALMEQPLRPGQREALAALIADSPLSIALDEELIAARTESERAELLERLRPQAIVIKPSLHGGFGGAEEWAALAGARGIRWWLNSALEGSVGHAALCEWCGLHAPHQLHGLGTGRLYAGAAPSRVRLKGCQLWEGA